MRAVLSLAFLLTLASFAFPAAAAVIVGKATEVEGDVKVTTGKTTGDLKKGYDVLQDDVIVTGKGAHVRILFKDQTDLTMSEKGKLTVDTFIYDPASPSKGKAHLGILGAAFSFIGGLIDKGPKPDVTIDLDFGSIGIRGTTIYRAMHNRECWIFVQKGTISVGNAAGEVTLQAGEGTIMSDKAKAPVSPRTWTRKEIRWIKAEAAGRHPGMDDW